MTHNLGVLLSLLVAFQLGFMALYLFTSNKGQKRNNWLLAAVFLMFAINLLDFSARVSGILFSLPLLHLLDDCFFFLYGPVLYFYTQAMVYRDFNFKKSDAWHLVPYVITTVYVVFSVIFTNRVTQAEFANRITAVDLPIWVPVVSVTMYLHILFYLWRSKQSISNYRSVIKNNFSSIDTINLDWLSFMIRTFAAITIAAMLNSILPAFHNTFFLYASALLLLLFSFYFVNRVFIKALNQSALFSGISRKDSEKYVHSNLDTDQLEAYKKELANLMQSSRPYLNADLKINDLAEKLNISSKVLSQVINQGFNQNFFDFINTYRCEEVKRALQSSDERITILEAMYQSGFNSKSSFNKEFKKLTGQTPSAFKNNLE